MMPPLMTVGSRPAFSSTWPIIEVVVVLPCVPETFTHHLERMSSVSRSTRGMTGTFLSCAATISGFVSFTAVDFTTTAGRPPLSFRMFFWSWPISTRTPSARRRCTLAFSDWSEPCTL